jgi:hypothetical protein
MPGTQLRHFVRLIRSGVQLDQPIEGFENAD